LNLKGGQLSGASQDEIELLHAGGTFARLIHKDSDSLAIQIGGISEQYRLLKVFEFSSDRKMMSVIVERVSDSRLVLFTKGADGSILPRAKDGEVEKGLRCKESVDMFANQGYRTLVFAMKELVNIKTDEVASLI
jgi:phospholipid-transporting ATPase